MLSVVAPNSAEALIKALEARVAALEKALAVEKSPEGSHPAPAPVAKLIDLPRVEFDGDPDPPLGFADQSHYSLIGGGYANKGWEQSHSESRQH